MAHEDKLELNIEVKSSPDKVWHGIKKFTILFPKAVPEVFKSFHVLEGDGESAGTVFLATLNPEKRISKEKVEFVDDERKTICYRVLEGDFMVGYRNWRVTLSVDSNNRGTTVVKYSAEFKKVKDEVPYVQVDSLRGIMSKIYHDLDAYLINNP